MAVLAAESAATWEAHVRSCHANRCEGRFLPCSLDLSPKTSQSFPGFSSLASAEEEIKDCLPGTVADFVCGIVRSLSIDAFASRREAVALKKVFLRMQGNAQDLEKQLTRISLFFYRENSNSTMKTDGTLQAFLDTSKALLHARSALAAIADGRVGVKRVCKLPRFPPAQGSQPCKTDDGIRIFSLIKKAEKALKLLKRGVEERCELEESQAGSPGRTNGTDAFGALIERVRCGGAEHPLLQHSWVVEFIEKVLVSRGVAKAINIRHSIPNVLDVFDAASKRASSLFVAFQIMDGQFVQEESRIRNQQKCDRHRWTLEALVPCCLEISRWLHSISTMREGSAHLFVSGDDNGAWVVPSNFQLNEFLSKPRSVADKYTKMLNDIVAREGWPPPSRKLLLSGSHLCRCCNDKFSKAFVTRSVCIKCETEHRETGLCPFALVRKAGQATCSPALWCPHNKKCGACENNSCADCRFHTLNGDGVASLVTNLCSRRGVNCVVFLDFDKTLSSTRRGNPPTSKNKPNRALLELAQRQYLPQKWSREARSHGLTVCVVTRNSHQKEISTWLLKLNVPMDVYCVGRKAGTTKADIILPKILEESGRHEVVGVFVDDTPEEHTDERLVSCKSLHRVLFSRGAVPVGGQ
jgi:hypothetical protein